MTDGTSQGLFIVVAIVIFGIFVVMAYILFEDTLSPALANMFTDSIEQTEYALISNKNMLRYNKIKAYPYYKDYTVKGNTISVTAVNPDYLVLQHHEPFVLGNTYKLSGYLYIDGEPATEDNWKAKNISTFYREENTTIDSNTGYFEGSYVNKSTTTFFLHALIYQEDGSPLPAGTVVIIKNLFLEDITNKQ